MLSGLDCDGKDLRESMSSELAVLDAWKRLTIEEESPLFIVFRPLDKSYAYVVSVIILRSPVVLRRADQRGLNSLCQTDHRVRESGSPTNTQVVKSLS